jgi:hypothetical protein
MEGEVELGTTQWRKAQPEQGCSKGAASPTCRGSAVGNRRPRGACASGMGGFGVQQIAGSRPGRWLVRARWGSRLGVAHQRRDALPHGGASLQAGVEQRRGEKAKGGREKMTGIQIKFSQNFSET